MQKYQTVDLLKPLIELLTESGITQEQLFTQPDIHAFMQSARAGLNEAAEIQLLQTLSSFSQHPDLPLRLGQRIKLTDFGTLSFALMSCYDLNEVLKLMIRYHPIVNRGPAWMLSTSAEGVALRAQPTLHRPALQQTLLELTFSAISAMGAYLLNRPLKDTTLQLNYPPPPHAKLYADFFPMPVLFNQTHNQLLIPEHDLNTPLQTANPAGHTIFLQQCNEMLRDLNRVENFSAMVRRLLIRSGGKFPVIKQVAQQLNVSERTLRRRLSSESSSFRAICDEVRNVLACQYLSDTHLTVADIAELLNYSETVSFRRAFVRWNGMTPQAYRRQR